mmetsp:Transcript_43048/g.69139  ORF Transcript_43048/g.69139 Transcript_43048/m.69139 type:complete len:268 (+) Transcript_43048:1842-2645(+)
MAEGAAGGDAPRCAESAAGGAGAAPRCAASARGAAPRCADLVSLKRAPEGSLSLCVSLSVSSSGCTTGGSILTTTILTTSILTTSRGRLESSVFSSPRWRLASSRARSKSFAAAPLPPLVSAVVGASLDTNTSLALALSRSSCRLLSISIAPSREIEDRIAGSGVCAEIWACMRASIARLEAAAVAIVGCPSFSSCATRLGGSACERGVGALCGVPSSLRISLSAFFRFKSTESVSDRGDLGADCDVLCIACRFRAIASAMLSTAPP